MEQLNFNTITTDNKFPCIMLEFDNTIIGKVNNDLDCILKKFILCRNQIDIDTKRGFFINPVLTQNKSLIVKAMHYLNIIE